MNFADTYNENEHENCDGNYAETIMNIIMITYMKTIITTTITFKLKTNMNICIL